MSQKISDLSQLTRNLRYFAKTSHPNSPPEEWPRLLATQVGISVPRLYELLTGRDATQIEQDKIAGAFRVEAATLGSSPLHPIGNDVLRENLSYLFASLRHGMKSQVAKHVGVKEAQLSRWENGVRPEKKHLERILDFFGLNPRLNLASELLFLSLEPVGAYAQKQWLAKRVDAAPPGEIGKLFEAFKRLLPPHAQD